MDLDWGQPATEPTNGNWNATGQGANDNMDWNAEPSSHENGNLGTGHDANDDEWSKNVSMHANDPDDANDGNADDKNCRNCGDPGHFARDCDKPKQFSGACFNCGQEGHSKAECTNPRVFTGTCRICNEPNHMAANCPSRPPMVCKNCNQEGHKLADCTNNRADYLTNVREVPPEQAWELVKAADAEKDLFQVREAIKIYAKAVPQTTFAQLEKAFRAQLFNVHIIAIEGDESPLHTRINLQGKVNCKYQVQFALRAHPKRKSTAQGWPASPEENMARLEDAGFVEDRGVGKCTNCGELGHSAKFCKEEKKVVEQPRVKCVNCGEEGHRSRDCQQERVDPMSCRNCGKLGHRASECEEPRSAEGVECKRCNEVGHFAKDCPNSGPSDMSCRNCGKEGHMARDCEEPRSMANMVCRNCDKMGHMSRDCPEPRDYSKVVCKQCGNTGHTVKRCPEAKEDAEGTEQDKENTQTTGYDNGAAAADWDQGVTTDSAGLNW